MWLKTDLWAALAILPRNKLLGQSPKMWQFVIKSGHILRPNFYQKGL